MQPQTPARVGLLVLRVWSEDGTEQGLRVRVTSVPDLADGRPQERVVASLPAALECVEELVGQFLPEPC